MSLRQCKQPKTRRFGLLCVCRSGFPIIFLASMLLSIGEKLVTAVAGWVNGGRFVFGAGASLDIVGGS